MNVVGVEVTLAARPAAVSVVTAVTIVGSSRHDEKAAWSSPRRSAIARRRGGANAPLFSVVPWFQNKHLVVVPELALPVGTAGRDRGGHGFVGILPAPRNEKSWATRRTVPFVTRFVTICGSTVRANWPQNGHWKSAHTSSVTGASALPIERPLARAAGKRDIGLDEADGLPEPDAAGARARPDDQQDHQHEPDDEGAGGDERGRILPGRPRGLAPGPLAIGVPLGEAAGAALLAARLGAGRRAAVQGRSSGASRTGVGRRR